MYQNKSRKIIEINPDLFTLRKTIKNKKEKKIKPQTEFKSNKIKKELLKKIKDYQKKTEDINQETKKNNEEKNNNDNFEDEFNKSLNFLQELSYERINNKNKKHTLKKTKLKTDINSISLNVPLEFESNNRDNKDTTQVMIQDNNKKEEHNLTNLSLNSLDNFDNFDNNNNIESQVSNINNIKIEEKPYGCLKSGTKPTFREWQKITQKNNLNNLNNLNKIEKIKIHNESTETNNNNFSERQNKLQEIKETFKKPTKTSLSVIDKNIKTTKYTLGKKGKRVGVLIKNNITRKNIKEDLSKLKKNSIIEIKNYLRKHNLIKVGSNAPNDVLREIYEQSIMAGDIHNINDQNYLANNL